MLVVLFLTRRIKAERVGTNTLPPMPDDGGVAYYSTTGSWSENTELMVSASGGTVKAFAGTVYSPSVPTPISPAPPSGKTRISIPRNADFVVTWQNAASQAGILLTVQYSTTLIQCLAPDSAGTISVPASLLAPIPTGAAAGNALSLTAIATSQADAGGSLVDLACWTSVAWIFD